MSYLIFISRTIPHSYKIHFFLRVEKMFCTQKKSQTRKEWTKKHIMFFLKFSWKKEKIKHWSLLMLGYLAM